MLRGAGTSTILRRVCPAARPACSLARRLPFHSATGSRYGTTEVRNAKPHRRLLARSGVADRVIDCLAWPHTPYAGTQGSHASESADDWVIVDSVRAPSTRGAYVLRWYAAAMSYLSIGLAATCSNASRWLSRSDALTSSDRSSRLTELTSWLSVCWFVQTGAGTRSRTHKSGPTVRISWSCNGQVHSVHVSHWLSQVLTVHNVH